METLRTIERPGRTREITIRSAVADRPRRVAAWRFKACRRCGGDMALQTDEYGFQDYTCIQCGATQPSPTCAA
jgi:hypothetical protein